MSRKRSSTTLDDVPAASSSEDQSSSEEEKTRTAKKSTTQAKRPSTMPKKSEEPKKLFQRIWSERDEITILTSLDEFSRKNTSFNIVTDIGALHDMIKKSVDFKECTQSQVNEKIRRMKDKYKKNARRDNYAPTKAHEKRTFELSHKLWADENNEHSEPPKPKPVPGGFDLGAAAMAAGVERNTVVLQAVDQLPADVKADLLAKWKAVGLSKVDLCARRTQLVAEELKSFHDSLT